MMFFFRILIFSSYVFSQSLLSDTTHYKIPLYEQSNLFKSYNLSQPIEQSLNYGSIGMFSGFAVSVIGLSASGEKDGLAWTVVPAVSMMVGGGIGFVYGVVRGAFVANDYEKLREANPQFHLEKDSYGYGLSGGNRFEYYLTKQFHRRNPVDISLGFSYAKRLLSSSYQSGSVQTNNLFIEVSYDTFLTKWLLWRRHLRVGHSKTKTRLHDVYGDRFSTSPFISIGTGIQTSLWDFVYSNLRVDYNSSGAQTSNRLQVVIGVGTYFF